MKATPKAYRRIEEYLDGLFRSGQLRPGDRLASERELAEKFGVSKMPVRQAMEGFIRRGMLEKRHGTGTYVTSIPGQPRCTGRIGVVYCHGDAGFFASSFYAAIITGIEQQAGTAGLQPVYRSLLPERGIPADMVIRDLAGEVDGFLVVDITEENREQVINGLKRQTLPVVLVNHEEPLENFDAVIPDSPANMAAAAAFIAGLGHRCVGCLYREHTGRRSTAFNFRFRLDMLRSALAGQDIVLPETLIGGLIMRPDRENFNPARSNGPTWFGTCSKADRETVRRMLALPDPPTAFICLDDEAAINLYRIADALGLRIPDDLTVIGYDNIRESEVVMPALTTVHVPLAEMGRLAMVRLQERIARPRTGGNPAVRTALGGGVVIRQSHKSVM